MTLSEDVELKEEVVLMSPPASDSGSGSPHQFSPYCVDSEPGSPLLDHEQVRTGHTHTYSMVVAQWLSRLQCFSVSKLISSVCLCRSKEGQWQF